MNIPQRGMTGYKRSKGRNCMHQKRKGTTVLKERRVVRTHSKNYTKWGIPPLPTLNTQQQGCGVEAAVVRSRRFLDGVGFLTTLGFGVGFFSDYDSRCPVGSFLTSHSKIGNSCWNGTISFETFVETVISCCFPQFPLIWTAKFPSFYVKESESGVRNFRKVGVGFGSQQFWKLGVQVGSRKFWKFGVESRIFHLRLRNPAQ